MKKLIMVILTVVIAIMAAYTAWNYNKNIASMPEMDIRSFLPPIEEEKKIEIPKILLNSDKDGDGIMDLDDIIEGARKDAANKTRYKDAYYENGGYPPDNEGVCTDVIWRAFKNAGYDLKKMVDDDIKASLRSYPRIWGEGERPDPNIDFRRVPNLVSFFKRHAQILTTEVKPWDVENLTEWQGGDIVVFDGPYEHIGIISDKRRNDGIPYLIHNGGPYTMEEDKLLTWHQNYSRITYHFRWPKQ